MLKNLKEYKTLVFDCDGVILNSNKIKSEAFYNSVSDYGHEVARQLVDHHIKYGGVSRYEKFKYFFARILNRSVSSDELNSVIDRYANEVRQGLLSSEVAEGLGELRIATQGATWLVASGGAQDELRVIFNNLNLAEYFDGGVFGSPTPKDKIVEMQLRSGAIGNPSLFLGDSRLDYEVANKFNLDFVFITQWSEFEGIEKYSKEHNIVMERDIKSLLSASGVE
ncbi:HAD family hydrolase [Alteromonas antoniana]|uniref:HAD family hydrolase n=1 Tax=Alteromonas antoniana TaxID=2803813 RepID=UPI001C46EFE5|nr:HAD hydrolase-like protein [Alteromonas antoniana]